MKHLTVKIRLSVFGAVLMMLSGCGPKVMVPPRIDLRNHEMIGIIEFSSVTQGNLQQFVTQKFLQIIQSSQPGVRVLELGNEEQVLKGIQHKQLNLEAIKAIGEKYNLRTLITGRLDVTDVKPKLNISPWLKSMGVEAVVEATLTARLFDTESSATIWTSSAKNKETVAHVTVFSGGPFFFDADDPEEAYGKLVRRLVEETTMDFQIRYERR